MYNNYKGELGMEKPNKLVAIVSNISGGCEYVAVVKNIKPSEYATLLKEQREHEQERKQELNSLKEQVGDLKSTIKSLQKEIAILKGEDYEESIED